MIMEPNAGESEGTPGIIRQKSGFRARARIFVSPAFSAIFRRPSQRHKMPVKFSEMLKADLAEENIAAVKSFQIPGAPENKADRNATTKKPAHNMFNIPVFSPISAYCPLYPLTSAKLRLGLDRILSYISSKIRQASCIEIEASIASFQRISEAGIPFCKTSISIMA